MDCKQLLAGYVEAGLLSGLDEEDDNCLGWFCRSLSVVKSKSPSANDGALFLFRMLGRDGTWADIAQHARFALSDWPVSFISLLSNPSEVEDDAAASLVKLLTKLEQGTTGPLLRYLDKVLGDRPRVVRRKWLDELGDSLSSPAAAPVLQAINHLLGAKKHYNWNQWAENELGHGRDLPRERLSEAMTRRLSSRLDAQTRALNQSNRLVAQRYETIRTHQATISTHAAELAARVKSQDQVIVKNRNLRKDNATLETKNEALEKECRELQSTLDTDTENWEASLEAAQMETEAANDKTAVANERIASLEAQVRSLSEKRTHDDQLLQGLIQTVQRVIAERDDDDDDGGRSAKKRRTDLDIVSAPRPAPEDPPSP